MNEQRLETYYQLIQSLLSCPSGEESEILAANQELLDADFVQVLTEVADYLAQQGEENNAELLRNLATYLTTPITQEDIEIYGQFILETLQKTAESNGDPQVIYPFLAANTDKLDRIFAELLRRWATIIIAEAEPDTATSIAADIVNFSNLIQQFPLGNKASNMEIAITGYEIALEVYTCNANPVNWATTQNNLGAAYSNRILGDRAENLELEISAYRAALEVYTRNANPVDWAMTQNNLGIAYSERILGERAENLELAITAYRAAVINSNRGELTFWQSQTEDLKALGDWANEYLGDYYNQQDQYKAQWQNHLEERLKNLAKILHIEEILAQLPEKCDRLILIPHRYLHLFPLHALPVKESYLIDLFPNGVGYAPSCQILQQVQMCQRPDFQSFFAIQNPTADLYQDYEKDLGAVAAIKKQFAHASILKQAAARKSAILDINENDHDVTLNEELLKANCIFFFCHGYFRFDSPLDSGLQLADGNLTLADIITHFKLEHCRLVTLSACETGMTDFSSISDEYIGLPSGFLLAGSTNVVSSLWTVNAVATALLMIKFYEELQQQSHIVLALKTAQLWLRDTTVQGFQDWLNISSLSIAYQVELEKHFNQVAKDKGGSTKPFESPFYWAAFCNIGKGV